MDITPISVVNTLLDLIKIEFPQFTASNVVTAGGMEIAKALLKEVHNFLTEYTFQEETVLECKFDSQVSSYSETLLDDAGNLVNEHHVDSVPLQRKVEILKFIAMHPNWSLTTLQNKGCKELKHSYYKKRWEEQIRRGETKFEKYQFIDQFVYEKFEEARKEFKFVKERDLQLWGLLASQSFRDAEFTFRAGHTWVSDFKKRHAISSRKVTKLVGRREIMSMEKILNSARKFQEEFRGSLNHFQPSEIINTDQVGFSYEITGNRTLSHIGEKDTLGVAKSPTNLATHSYTAHYVISMAGKIVGDVYICLQERSGRLGPKINEQLFPAANVCLTCSTSGKLTTSLYEYCLDNVIIKNVSCDFLLLIDSWPGQTNAMIYADRFGVNGVPQCTVKIIPKKFTSICQPLDTTFHRQLKYFARAIYSEALLRYSNDINPIDEITTRNNIIRLHSLVHNQLSTPIFEPMIKYCWYSSGLTDDRPLFFSVKDVSVLKKMKSLHVI